MKITPLISSFLQERATPCAWLPALAQVTPRRFSSSDRLTILLYAPRSLYERTTCRSSRLRIHPHRIFRKGGCCIAKVCGSQRLLCVLPLAMNLCLRSYCLRITAPKSVFNE